ncbi:Uncharacterised protein [Mycobacteroides abscessus subsp. abscessus]|nr:Uncharacterised protein [Mycobacteroides abscessus subsp. abscessus]
MVRVGPPVNQQDGLALGVALHEVRDVDIAVAHHMLGHTAVRHTITFGRESHPYLRFSDVQYQALAVSP